MERTRVTAINRYTRYNEIGILPSLPLPILQREGLIIFISRRYSLFVRRIVFDSSLFPRRFRNILPPARSG